MTSAKTLRLRCLVYAQMSARHLRIISGKCGSYENHFKVYAAAHTAPIADTAASGCIGAPQIPLLLTKEPLWN